MPSLYLLPKWSDSLQYLFIQSLFHAVFRNSVDFVVNREETIFFSHQKISDIAVKQPCFSDPV